MTADPASVPGAKGRVRFPGTVFRAGNDFSGSEQDAPAVTYTPISSRTPAGGWAGNAVGAKPLGERPSRNVVGGEAAVTAPSGILPPRGRRRRAAAANQWPSLVLYVGDGRLTIDDSPAEQAVRPLAVSRNNWLHIGGDGGLRPAAVLLRIAA
jgi:hypothetical protein